VDSGLAGVHILSIGHGHACASRYWPWP